MRQGGLRVALSHRGQAMFEDHLRQAEAAQDAYLGVRCTLTPRKAGRYTLEADRRRASAEFIGTLAQVPDLSSTRPSRGEDTGLMRAHSSDELSVSLIEVRKLPYRPEKDDLITVGECNFAVTIALPGPDGGLQILLNSED